MVRVVALFSLLAALLSGADALLPASFTRTTIAHRESNRVGVTMRARICDLTGKRANRQAMTVSFSHKRTKKVQGVNLQKKRIWWPEGNKFVTIRISTKGLRTVEKLGLNEAAKKYDLDLTEF